MVGCGIPLNKTESGWVFTETGKQFRPGELVEEGFWHVGDSVCGGPDSVNGIPLMHLCKRCLQKLGFIW